MFYRAVHANCTRFFGGGEWRLPRLTTPAHCTRFLMSSSSSSGDGTALSDEAADPTRLAKRVCRRLQRSLKTPLPTAYHRSVVETMEKLAPILAERAPGDPPLNEVPLALTCAGIAVARRLAREVEDDETHLALQRTLALLFVLVLGARATVPAGSSAAAGATDAATGEGGPGDDVQPGMFDSDVLGGVCQAPPPPESDEACVLREYEESSLDDALRLAAGGAAANSWQTHLRSPEALCMLLIDEGLGRLARGEALHRYEPLAEQFFWASAAVTAKMEFDKVAPSPFVSMHAASILADGSQSKRLRALVDAAESEIGQAVLRDLQLSFALPRRVVGIRRCAVIGRATNVLITANHPTVLNEAHASALRGAVWEYEHSTSETVRMCALLAGLAVIMGRNGDMRKDDAFSGRVCLPFLETTPPPDGGHRLTLLPETGSWLVWTIDARSKELVVVTRQQGYQGCLQAVLAFASFVRPAG